MTKSLTIHNAWSISVTYSKDLFSGSAEYSGFMEKTSSETWSEEKTETHEICVTKGGCGNMCFVYLNMMMRWLSIAP